MALPDENPSPKNSRRRIVHPRLVQPLQCPHCGADAELKRYQDKLANVRADIAIVILTARQNLPRKHGTIERIAEKYQENDTIHL